MCTFTAVNTGSMLTLCSPVHYLLMSIAVYHTFTHMHTHRTHTHHTHHTYHTNTTAHTHTHRCTHHAQTHAHTHAYTHTHTPAPEMHVPVCTVRIAQLPVTCEKEHRPKLVL